MKKELIRTERYIHIFDEAGKQLAHLPLNDSPILEGVPLLPPLEDEDVWSMGLEARLKELPYTKHLDDGMFNDGQVSGFESGAEWGYNKAREKYKFTEEHAKYLFECGRNFQINADITFTVAREHLLQPKSPTHFEFEIERKSVLNLGIEPFNPNTHVYTNEPKITTNSQGQVVACGKYIY